MSTHFITARKILGGGLRTTMTEFPASITTVLVTGGHGFLVQKGAHVAKRLYDKGDCIVKVVDIAPSPPPSIGPVCHEFINGNLCDPTTCIAAVQGVSVILHFAANMGGMGTIHEQNDAAIYDENHSMVHNLLKAASLPGSTVSKFFFASSACVYPETLQHDKDISLRERDVFAGDGTIIPQPQGLYGLEKLNSELLLNQYAKKFDVRIARLHNIYGPGGSWNGGREKAPAAFLRKALVCRRLMKLSQRQLPDFEIWGDGTQRRSFLFISDAVDAIIKLLSDDLDSDGRPIIVNVGSDRAVSIRELAELSLRCAEAQAAFSYDTSKPVGVASRNSNNELSATMLGWTPTVSLENGMKQTCDWICVQLDNHLTLQEQRGRGPIDALQDVSTSRLVDLEGERMTFAILLPITSRGSVKESDCLDRLRNFVQTLHETTLRDVHTFSGQTFRYEVYLAIDTDDLFLLQEDQAKKVLITSGIPPCQIHQVINKDHPQGHICGIWRDCARLAYQDGCDYFVLMGDDVTLMDEGWMRKAHSTFVSLAKTRLLPFGLGCVAFTDVSFPGMPTFPIIHRTHMDVFNGEIVPDIFINQDGDPFLFQLYRRWGTSTMFPCRLENSVGGPVAARYIKQHSLDWSLAPLVRADQAVGSYLRNCHGFDESDISSAHRLTLDVIVPCYRVDLDVLSTILSLEIPPSASVNFIVIIDNLDSPYVPTLLARYSQNPNIRIRVNDDNLGASFSRNRGLAEASAEWVHFLDNDVVPSLDLLFNVCDAIKANPEAAGFVCNTRFPLADSIFTAAVHLSGVTYFWDIAAKLGRDIPWGVTANLVARRLPNPGVPQAKFSLSYPKTGGGEDIDYCLSQRNAHISSFLKDPINVRKEYPGFLPAPHAIVVHPWWNGGNRSYWRFYNWSLGDGHLIDAYPNLAYWDYAPNSAECFFICALVVFVGGISLSPDLQSFGLRMASCIFLANLVHDVCRHSLFHPERTDTMDIAPRIRESYFLWSAAMLESSFIRMFSELGRLRGIMRRREWRSVGKRFDWFAGRIPGDMPKKEERRNSVERIGISLVLYATMAWLKW